MRKTKTKTLAVMLANFCMVIGAATAQAQTTSARETGMVLPTDKSVNFRLSPGGLLVGVANLAAEWKVSDNFSFGPSVGYVNWNIGDVGLNGYSVGIRGTYYPDLVFRDGWYVSPRLSYDPIRVTARDQGVAYKGDAGGTRFVAMAGYHWFWENFNMNFGAGVAVNSVSKFDLRDDAGNRLEKVATYYTGVTPVVDLDLGLTF